MNAVGRDVLRRRTHRWFWTACTGVAVAGLVLVPSHVRIGSIAVKCRAPVLTVLSLDVPGQCLPPADLRLGAATGVVLLASGVRVTALGRRSRRERRP